MSGAGFYKKDTTELRYAPNRVLSPTLNLTAANHAAVYPIEGWYWFDSTEEAFKFLGIPFYFETPTQTTERQEAKLYPKLIALAAMTPTQVQTWVQNNVNTLAEAKDAIKTLAVAVSILARQL